MQDDTGVPLFTAELFPYNRIIISGMFKNNKLMVKIKMVIMVK